MGEDEPMPAHISGNMWAQTWQLTYDLVAPFPDVENPLAGVDDELAAQGYTVPDIFQGRQKRDKWVDGVVLQSLVEIRINTIERNLGCGAMANAV